MHAIEIIVIRNARAAGREAAAAWQDGRPKQSDAIAKAVLKDIERQGKGLGNDIAIISLSNAYNAGYDSVRPREEGK